jgi:hypothetical protein
MKLFVFILLATLSIVNAIPLHKRALTFEKCPGLSASPLTVKATPDPLVPGGDSTFDISGELAAPPSKGSNIVVLFYDPAKQAIVGEPTTSDVCPVTDDCTGTDFTTSLAVKVPADLPEAYSVVVGVSNVAEESIEACSIANNGVEDSGTIPPF